MLTREGHSKDIRSIVLNVGNDTFLPLYVKIKGMSHNVWEKVGVFDQKLLYNSSNMTIGFPSNIDQEIIYDQSNMAGEFI